MEIQKSQASGRHGLIFHISRFSVTPSNQHRLNTLYFHDAHHANWELSQRLRELYDRMLARDRSCAMSVLISRPLTRQQADLLNEQRTDLAVLVGSVVGSIASSVLKMGSLWAAREGRKLSQDRLRTYHSGDVIVGAEAHVQGGIGPQRTVMSMLIPVQVG